MYINLIIKFMKIQIKFTNFYVIIIMWAYFTIIGCSNPEPDCPDRANPYLEVHSIAPVVLDMGNTINIELWNDFNEEDLEGNLNVKVNRVYDNCTIQENNFDIVSRFSLPVTIIPQTGVGSCGGWRAGDSYIVYFTATATTTSNPPESIYLTCSETFRITGGGSGGVTEKFAHIELDYMNASGENYSEDTDDCFNSIKSSLGIADIKITATKTSLEATNTVKDFYWNADQYTYPAWTVSPDGFQTFITQNRNPNNPRKFYICGARKFTYRSGGSSSDTYYIGYSNLTQSDNLTGSFIFFKSADLLKTALNDPNINLQSLYNVVANHETVHQLGLVGNEGHSNHTEGSLRNRCALNEASTLYGNSTTRQQFFYNYNSVLEFCELHVNLMRSRSEQQLDADYQKIKKIGYPQNEPKEENDNDVILLQIPKSVYKKYEPVEIMVRYINNGNSADSVYFMFDENQNFIEFNILNEQGKNVNEKYEQCFTLGIALEPHYIIEPNDTLMTTITLNSYGKMTEDNSLYFQYNNYFPVGKYKLIALINGDIHKKFTIPIKTNEIKFDVIDIDQTDKNVIELSNEGKFYEIKEKYSNNYFFEFALKEYVKSNIGKYEKNEITRAVLENSYLEFFNLFTQSYYTIPFVKQYLSLVSNDIGSNIDIYVQKLIKDFKNSPIEEYLKNSITIPSLKKNIVKSKKVERRLNK